MSQVASETVLDMSLNLLELSYRLISIPKDRLRMRIQCLQEIDQRLISEGFVRRSKGERAMMNRPNERFNFSFSKEWVRDPQKIPGVIVETSFELLHGCARTVFVVRDADVSFRLQISKGDIRSGEPYYWAEISPVGSSPLSNILFDELKLTPIEGGISPKDVERVLKALFDRL
jgi:hypothetical protein